MKNRYTKKQIVEAIAYWTQQLKLMTESHKKCVDALVSEFGRKLVYSKKYDYNLTKTDLKKIYNILNYTLFSNALGQIQLEYWPERLVVNKLNENALKSGVIGKQKKRAPCYGAYSAVCRDVLDKRGKIVDISISDDVIMLNKTYLKDCIFIFAVASICHEMIHFYDRFTDEFHNNQLKASQTGIGFDSHKDILFQHMMEQANKNGINVVETLANTPFELANSSARYALKNVLGEEDGSDTHVNAGYGRITIRAKGSHSFVFMELD